MRSITLFGALAIAVAAVGQSAEDIRWIQQHTNVAALRAKALEFEAQAKKDKAEAIRLAEVYNLPLRVDLPDGTVAELIRFRNGKPEYYRTDNHIAAQSTSTNQLYPGGAGGYSLTGSGMNVGEWDGGAVRLTHQELTGRVTQVDGATNQSNHATHVAGTLIASGVQSNAKGMAYAANLLAHDWNSDDAEMATAAANGLLVSNHSYGSVAGWAYGDWAVSGTNEWHWWGDPPISTTEDWSFGFYNQQAEDWDLMAHNAPYYLIVKSAGNDRGDYHNGTHKVWNGGWVSSTDPRNADGNTLGYDCVTTYGSAKNILTIGAVNDIPGGWSAPSDVVMSSFSGWGPTDDGRIKPDICGNGVGLYSSSSSGDAQYTTMSGTSMSAPNVTGSLILLQQHYHNLNNIYMRAASLKGLIIHTADEAGPSAGPDYQHGWGMLNVRKAADFLSNGASNFLIETALNSGATYTFPLTANGIDPVRVTISWTDEPGNAPGSGSLNPTTLQLVNDLDVRIISNGGMQYLPYVLNPANPAAAATTGDNFRDNVEMIFPGILPFGQYTVQVTHKGASLVGGSQPFTLLVSGVPSAPVAAMAVSSSSICVGDAVTFNDLTSGGPSSWNWSISPASYAFTGGSSATTQSPTVQFNSAGTYTVQLVTSNSIGSDTATTTIVVGGYGLPFTEGFESPTTVNRWTINNPDAGITWTTTGVSGNGSATAMGVDNFNYSTSDVVSQLDDLDSPPLTFSGYSSVNLTFDYAYRQYGSGYTDSMAVYVSSDCGTTWTRVASFKETGSNNWVTAGALTTAFTPSTSADWCAAPGFATCPTINLDAYAGMSNIKVRFRNLSGWGNNLYLDNININGVQSLAPVADFSANFTAPCINGNVAFTDLSTNSPTSWLWTFTPNTVSYLNGSSATSQNPEVSFNAAGSYQVTLQATNANGSDTEVKTSYINAVSGLVPSVTVSANNTTICSGTSVIFTANHVNGGMPMYQWKVNGNNVGTNSSMFVSSTLANNDQVTVTITSSLSCVSTPTATSAPVTMTVLAPVVPSVAVTPSQSAVCAGTSVTFTATPTNGGTPSYQWKKNGVNVGTNSATYTTSNLTTSDVFTVVMSSTENCLTSSTATSAPVSVTVHALPTLSMNAIGSLCSTGPAIPLTGTPAGGTFTIGGNAVTQIDPAALGAGTHQVVYNYTDPTTGCSNAVTQAVTIYQTPAVPVVTQNGNLLSTNASGGTLQWYDSMGAILGATGSSYTMPSNGTYYVVVNNNGCSASSALINFNSFGVEDLSVVGVVYPNPTTGQVTLQWEGSGAYTVVLVDAKGAVVTVAQGTTTTAASEVDVDLSGYAAGIYTLRVTQDQRILQARVQKL